MHFLTFLHGISWSSIYGTYRHIWTDFILIIIKPTLWFIIIAIMQKTVYYQRDTYIVNIHIAAIQFYYFIIFSLLLCDENYSMNLNFRLFGNDNTLCWLPLGITNHHPVCWWSVQRFSSEDKHRSGKKTEAHRNLAKCCKKSETLMQRCKSGPFSKPNSKDMHACLHTLAKRVARR